MEKITEQALFRTVSFGSEPNMKTVKEAMRLFAAKAQAEIHELLFDEKWHKHHKEALCKCITVIEELKKQEGVEQNEYLQRTSSRL